MVKTALLVGLTFALTGCGLVVGLRGDYVLGDGGAAAVDASVDSGPDTSTFDSPSDVIADTQIPDVNDDVATACFDNLTDFGETDKDCGGATPCPRCIAGKMCLAGSDCMSGVCLGNNKCK